MRKLKRLHHLLGIFSKKIASCRIQLIVANKKRVADRSFVRTDQRKKTEQRTGPACNVAAYKLFRNALRHTKDIARVLVIIPHERLAAKLAISRGIIESFCDLFLQIHVQDVGGPPSRVVQISPQAQEKLVGPLDLPLVAFAQPIFAHQLICA